MRVLNCEQYSDEWWAARIGIPSASEFGKIVTPKGKLSAQSEDYANRLVAEWALGHRVGWDGQTAAMENGTNMEAEGRAYYEMLYDVEVQQVGLITRDDGMVGASPDGLVGDNGLLEIKCPEAWTHVGYMLGSAQEDKYRAQTQGQLLICEREWVDLVSYHPDFPEAVVRLERDDIYIATLGKALDAFVEILLEKREQLRQRGVGPESEPEISEPAASAAGIFGG